MIIRPESIRRKLGLERDRVLAILNFGLDRCIHRDLHPTFLASDRDRFFFWYFEHVLKRHRDKRSDPRVWAFLLRDPHRAGGPGEKYREQPPPLFKTPPRRFGPLEVYSVNVPTPR